MRQSEVSETELSVEVRNLGGIEESTVGLRTGVNVLSGRNATNRTSFLRALMGALGSDGVSLKADADAGSVTLRTPTGTYSRRLERRAGGVQDSGDPYLDDPTLADLFAFLLESNEARQAVSRQDDLREVIMRPVDVEAINAEIEELRAEKRRVDERLDELGDLDAERAELEAERADLDAEIERVEAELEDERAALEAMEGSVEATQAEQEALDERLETLQSVQSELEETRYRRETERESVETLREEREGIESELDGLPEGRTDEREGIEAELDALRQRQSELDSTTSQLQSVIQFNEEMLEGTNQAVAEALRGESESTGENLTDQLLAEESVVCWTCGSEVDSADIESTLDRLRAVRQETLAERREIGEEIESLTAEKRELEAAADTRAELETRLERTNSEIERRTERIESLTDQLAELRERASELEAEIEAHEQSTNSTVLEQHTAITQLEFELGRLESDREAVDEQLDALEDKAAERERLDADREELSERLETLRTRVEALETEAIEAFNDHMDAVLDTLGYDNLERIWIERTTETVRESRRLVEQSAFELHIVRSTDDGRAYEDTIDHLSESEREVTGLVFALAGYLVHEVYEELPVMVLDSLEAIDADRIAALVDYLSEYAETIVVALLPEDAQALDDDYHRVTEI